VAALRAAFFEIVTPAVMKRLVAKLVQDSEKCFLGNVLPAYKLLFAYCLGKPGEEVDPGGVDLEQADPDPEQAELLDGQTETLSWPPTQARSPEATLRLLAEKASDRQWSPETALEAAHLARQALDLLKEEGKPLPKDCNLMPLLFMTSDAWEAATTPESEALLDGLLHEVLVANGIRVGTQTPS